MFFAVENKLVANKIGRNTNIALEKSFVKNAKCSMHTPKLESLLRQSEVRDSCCISTYHLIINQNNCLRVKSLMCYSTYSLNADKLKTISLLLVKILSLGPELAAVVSSNRFCGLFSWCGAVWWRNVVWRSVVEWCGVMWSSDVEWRSGV